MEFNVLSRVNTQLTEPFWNEPKLMTKIRRHHHQSFTQDFRVQKILITLFHQETSVWKWSGRKTMCSSLLTAGVSDFISQKGTGSGSTQIKSTQLWQQTQARSYSALLPDLIHFCSSTDLPTASPPWTGDFSFILSSRFHSARLYSAETQRRETECHPPHWDSSSPLFTSSIRQLIHRHDYMLLIKQLIS